MEPPVRYRNHLVDSARWDGIPLRDGDLIIATPAKCGTTWLQLICGLLIFQTPELPQPLDALSPWIDLMTRRPDDLRAALAAQPHRRVLKSHTPLDGLPFDPRVTYLCLGRDPRDVGISLDNHLANMNLEAFLALREAATGETVAPADVLPEPADTARGRFFQWADGDDIVVSLAAMLHHLTTFWERRQEPNVLLLHYDQLRTDLAGQMRRLAGRLGLTIEDGRWPELVRAATFEAMRERSRELVPVGPVWHDPARFFHRGTSGQWRDLLDDDDLRRYRARVGELVDPALAAWLHHGPI